MRLIRKRFGFFYKLTFSFFLPRHNLTLLHIAAFFDSTECLLVLLNNKVPINIFSAADLQPLHYAVLSGSLECASILLAEGADPNYSPADIHLSSNLYNFIHYFIHSITPLYLAARNGSTHIMNLLFDYGAKFDQKVISIRSPLNETLRCGHIQCFYILIERGMRPTIQFDQKDFSPLMLSIKNKDLHEAIPILLQNGENVNARTKNGFSPLFLACMLGNFDIVQMLCNDSTLQLDTTGPGNI